MSAAQLKAAREDLATALAPVLGRPVHATVPEALDPPCVIIQAADPYLAPGETFEDWSLSLDLFVVTELFGNAQATDDTEDLLEDLLAALDLQDGYGVDRVGRPGPIESGDWVANAITVTVSRFITL